ncbi:Ankyrin repeat-containing protein [Actinidia chinensis var. chinensis]|uniref:Ankyrin repeat-containing protein n=1 Tax=Actinidia chinensis var. chinensis TaxID=1590841 RepID=A0A2R6QLW2_ACTCC|nr:Ankyrin repeat-containing protein [Actinidia chinensis var. chinensis]
MDLSISDEKLNSKLYEAVIEGKDDKEVVELCKETPEGPLHVRVKNISVPHLTKYLNNDRKTAEELFETNNTKLRDNAKEWLKRTAENCSIVSVLIATVAFAAAYTVPGGPNQNTGYPILQKKSFFVIFTLADVLSLAFALASVMTFLSILTSSFQFKDFKQSLPQRLMLGVTLLIVSVSMMMLAFAATVILLIRDKEQWTRIALYSVAFFPVFIFLLSYLPLYTELVKAFMHSLKKISEVFPRFDRNQSPPTLIKL